MCVFWFLLQTFRFSRILIFGETLQTLFAHLQGVVKNAQNGAGPPLKYQWNYVPNIRSQFPSYVLAAGWTSSMPYERYCYHVTCYEGDCMFTEVPTGFHAVCEHPVAITRWVEWFLSVICLPTKTTTHNIPAGRIFQSTVLSNVTLYSLESLRLFSVYSRFSTNSVLVSHRRHELMLRQLVLLSQ